MSLTHFILSFIISAITIIMIMINVMALWKLFKKANKSGWTSLIPFYNYFVLFEIIGMNPWWLCILFTIYFFQYFFFIYILASNIVLLVLLPIILLFTLIIWYIVICASINLSRCFNKDSGFSVGLIFMPCIFLPILAFENSSYIGPNPINDFIFSSHDKVSNIKYCLNCGKKITDNSIKFCTNCGKCLIKK